MKTLILSLAMVAGLALQPLQASSCCGCDQACCAKGCADCSCGCACH